MDDAKILESSAQHIKDFKLAIEFKYLMKHSPAGVYLMPEFENIRKLHGVIFLRRGLYRDGIFRFQIVLPLEYNDINTHPEIFFCPPIFNPLVDPASGRLDLKSDEVLKEWQPERHFIVTAITFLKKIFYMKSFDSFETVPNEEARNLYNTDKDAYYAKILQCVEESSNRIYDVQPENCSMIFTESKPAHEEILREILLQGFTGSSDNIDISSNGDDNKLQDITTDITDLDLDTAREPMDISTTGNSMYDNDDDEVEDNMHRSETPSDD